MNQKEACFASGRAGQGGSLLHASPDPPPPGAGTGAALQNDSWGGLAPKGRGVYASPQCSRHVLHRV